MRPFADANRLHLGPGASTLGNRTHGKEHARRACAHARLASQSGGKRQFLLRCNDEAHCSVGGA